MQIFCQSDKLSPRYKIKKCDPETKRARRHCCATADGFAAELRRGGLLSRFERISSVEGECKPRREVGAHSEKLELSNKFYLKPTNGRINQSVLKKLRESASLSEKKVNC